MLQLVCAISSSTISFELLAIPISDFINISDIETKSFPGNFKLENRSFPLILGASKNI